MSQSCHNQCVYTLHTNTNNVYLKSKINKETVLVFDYRTCAKYRRLAEAAVRSLCGRDGGRTVAEVRDGEDRS